MAEEQKMTDGDSQVVWNETNSKEALAHLERLQERLDGLRDAMPKLIQPLARSSGSTAMYGSIRSVATKTIASFKDFREACGDDKTKSILSATQQSYDKDSDLSKASNVPAWGWAD